MKETAKLLPADIEEILEEYGHYLKSYTQLKDKDSIFASYKRNTKRLEVLFPLIEHPIHGITGLHVVENYGNDGYVRQYHYQWKVIVPKSGIQTAHISGWGNDAHDAEWTPEEYRVATEPHHHHYDPNDRRKRKENYDVRSLKDAFAFIAKYLESKEEYTVQ
ncbi:DUF6516 family protein [Lysinibacillus piscis]|uniref:Uncharacterized protein n=1 Tax=Lysinibacillus piscis TaxID=2518931 RepID=A0ABQ5NP47_9BACI|nr:DUF6516 family protein [Lysinibacillus sp. KH24]GLC90146.1 hypothetical protein LYSBPC_32730 [Lysinibacillus sp. KH24]